MELRRWLRVGFTGVAVDSRASAFDGDSASWIAAICSALPTPGKGWSQTWSARRRDAPVDVERCESPDALRALLVEAADWGRWRGMMLQLVAPRGVCEGLPRAWGGLFPCRRRRRSFVTPLMLRGDASPCPATRTEGQRLSRRASPRLDFGVLWGDLEVSL